MNRRRAAHLRRRPPEQGGDGVVVAATAVLSGLNYLYTVSLVWLLPPDQYVVVGSISALLLTWGTVSGAAVPWVLAREVVLAQDDQQRRQRAVAFSAGATVLQALGGGVLTWVIAVHYAAPPALAAAFASVICIFGAATVCGYLQGSGRFRLYAGLRVAEVIVKIGVGLGLVLLHAGASGAISGFACGAALVALVGAGTMGRDIAWDPTSVRDRRLWHMTGGLFSIQGGVAALVSLDYVVGSLVLHTAGSFATYQAANILARVPLYVGGAVSLVVFPRLVRAERGHAREMRDSLALFARICVPVAAVTMTAPPSLLSHLFPHAYGNIDTVLPIAAVGGLALGLVNLATTFFQASGVFAWPSAVLGAGVLVGIGLDDLLLRWYGVVGLAAAVVIEGGMICAVLMTGLRRRWPGALRHLTRPVMASAAVVVPLAATRNHLALWLAIAVFGGALPAVLALIGSTRDPASERPRLLYLRYGDSTSGSPGFSETAQLLAAKLDFLFVCGGHCDLDRTVPSGFRHFHVPSLGGGRPSRLLYGALAPLFVATHRSDLVAHEHGALGWSAPILRFVRRPVVGVLDAAPPRSRAGRRGLRHYSLIVARSDAIATEALTRAPLADIVVAAERPERMNGVLPPDFPPAAPNARRRRQTRPYNEFLAALASPTPSPREQHPVAAG